MKKVYAIALFVVLSATLCLADNIHEFSLTWNVTGVGNHISLQTSNGGEIVSSFGGTFSSLVPEAICINSPCTFFTTVLRLSKVTASDVIFHSVFYPTVYFSGALYIITNVRLVGENGNPSIRGVPGFGVTGIVGDLTACSDPSCSSHLFLLDIDDGFAWAHPNFGVTFNSSGQPVLTSATLATTPEPGSIALLGTGCAVLFWIVRRRRKASDIPCTQT